MPSIPNSIPKFATLSKGFIMFSTIVAGVAFVITTLVLLFWVYDEFIRQKSSLELTLIAHGKCTINWLNVWIMIGVWIGSGVYLWG